MNSFLIILSIIRTVYRLKQLILLMVPISLMALLETASIASIAPFLTLLDNQNLVFEIDYLKQFYSLVYPNVIGSVDEFVILCGFLAIFFILIAASVKIITTYFLNRYTESLRSVISNYLVSRFVKRDYTFFINRHSSDLTKVVISEVDQLISNIFRPVINMMAQIVVVIALLIFLLLTSPPAILYSAILLVLIYYLVFLSLKKKLGIVGMKRSSANQQRYWAVSELFSNIKILLLSQRTKHYEDRFEDAAISYARSQHVFRSLSVIPQFALEAFTFVGVITLCLIFYVTSDELQDASNQSLLSIVGVNIFLLYKLQPALRAVLQGFTSLKYGHHIASNIYHDLLDAGQREELIDQNFPTVGKSIRFEDVSFSYPHATAEEELTPVVLNNLNFEILIGKSTAIIGKTGSGKSTVADLLLGLLRPTTGRILADEKELNAAVMPNWAQKFGYVPQDYSLTDGSIRENIALGIDPPLIIESQIQEASRLAGAFDFIDKLPYGFDTKVGERGVRLSGGQKQRIAIARALYSDPEILILDEATSALDTVTEEVIVSAVERLLPNKTIIVIAHRMSTIKNCDQVLEFKQGKLVTKSNSNKEKSKYDK